MEDESDALMQMDRASQAGSTDRMELEHGLSESAAAALPLAESASAFITEQRDMDLEYGQDGQPDPSIEDIQDSLKQDIEMGAEMAEQAHLAEEKDWKDVDADVTIIESILHSDSKDFQHEDANEDIHPESLSKPQTSPEHGSETGRHIPPELASIPKERVSEQPLEKGQLTLEDSLAGAGGAQADNGAANEDISAASLTNQEVDDNEEAYADA